MSICVDSPSDETSNRGPLALLLLDSLAGRIIVHILQWTNIDQQSSLECISNHIIH